MMGFDIEQKPNEGQNHCFIPHKSQTSIRILSENSIQDPKEIYGTLFISNMRYIFYSSYPFKDK